MRILLLLVLVGLTQSLSNDIYKKQLKGIKKLLKGSDSGIFPTCNMVLFSEMKDFDAAEAFCESFEIGSGREEAGNLATVDDDDKNSDLKMLLGMAYPGNYGDWDSEAWVWAGLRKTSHNVGFLSKSERVYRTDDWEWTNGENPLEFQKWMRDQPDQRALKLGKKGCLEKEGCFQNQMRINSKGKWDDTFKYQKHPYVCDYHGKYLVSALRKTWLDARTMCEEAGLVLAEVTSAAELKEILFIMDAFLGTYDPNADVKVYNNTNWVWIGGDDLEEEGTWMWPDHHEIEGMAAMAWRKPQPDNADYAMEKGQDVLALSRWGEFDDSYEEKRKRPFACMCPHD